MWQENGVITITCPECGAEIEKEGHCVECPICGWEACGLE